ncbi:hypothetical protein AB1Y20_020430 [Prymnesium parvum]|uniref:Uncharacterized protein n=1 Tax=Prymnesium parvum TaxID=97485 RepID=A0AB34JUM7_PRYPA
MLYERDPNAALLRSSSILHGPHQREPWLPMLAAPSGGRPTVCAAYRLECVPGSKPMRARLGLPRGLGGLGEGVPAASHGATLGDGRHVPWRLRARDFCRKPPREILRLPNRTDILRGRKYGIPSPRDCFCSTESLLPRFDDPRGFGRRVPAGALPGVPRADPSSYTCQAGNAFVTFQCSEVLLLPPPRPAGARIDALPHLLRVKCIPCIGGAEEKGVHVLIATYDHYGHGLLAIVQRVINQLWLARGLGHEPFVFLGERPFAEPQACEYGSSTYFEASLGSNMWDYWFRQPGDYRLGMRSVRGRRISSLEVAAVGHADRSGPVRAYGSPRYYNRVERQMIRLAAHQFVGVGGAKLVRGSIRRRAHSLFREWRQFSTHVLGIHVRGTDKVVQPKVPPEAYFPFIDAYLAAFKDAAVFVATDDKGYMERIRSRYRALNSTGRLLTAAAADKARTFSTSRDDVLLAESAAISAYEKGAGVLVDALLLSQCDFLLKATSAVAEFALWANPSLHHRHLDLQITDRFRSQSLPSWTHFVGMNVVSELRNSKIERRTVAEVFCSALAAGCALEPTLTYRQNRCSVCDLEYARAAKLMSRGRASVHGDVHNPIPVPQSDS